MKVAIYVPAYEAARTIDEVVRRTATVAADLGATVLVQDDASHDDTVTVAQTAARRAGVEVTVAANPVNLGYGGNLKHATAVLATGGADVVAMVHGDLQYRPEDVPALVAPLLAGDADLVLGSRMTGSRRAAAMPRYKWVGNRALTAAINRRFHTRLTDPHTGLVAFTTAMAAAIDLASCADGHELTADMIVRALGQGSRVAEIPVVTSYGPGSRSCSPSTSVRYGLYLLRSLGGGSRPVAHSHAVTP